MFEVTFIKEIKNVEEKFIANLTKRQIISLTGILLVSVPTYIYVRPVIGKELCDWLIILIALLGGAIGWYKKNDHPFEEYIRIVLRYRYAINQKRVWRLVTQEEKQFEEEYQRKLQQLRRLRKEKKDGRK